MFVFFFFLMIRRPPRSTLFPYHDALPISDALKSLLAKDEGRDVRQVAMIDARGRVASHTGSKCIEAAGDRTGANYSVQDRKSTRLNSSHANISYAVFCLKKKNTNIKHCTK